jgi:uncharacterized membrane protein
MDVAAEYAIAYGLTTSAGLRGLLTLAAVSIAVHFGMFSPPEQFAWLGSTTVTIVLVALAIVEFIADKIPVVDSAFHLVQAIVKPAAAAILVGGIVHAPNTGELYALMALGALNAFGVNAGVAATRGASTVTTGGMANPFVSLFEDAVALVMLALAYFAPFLLAALAIVLTVMLTSMAITLWRKRHRSTTAT